MRLEKTSEITGEISKPCERGTWEHGAVMALALLGKVGLRDPRALSLFTALNLLHSSAEGSLEHELRETAQPAGATFAHFHGLAASGSALKTTFLVYPE